MGWSKDDFDGMQLLYATAVGPPRTNSSGTSVIKAVAHNKDDP